MRILAFDQALVTSGWAAAEVLPHRPLGELSYGVIQTKPSQPLVTRLLHIEAQAAALITHFDPDLIITEKIFCSGKGSWRLLIRVECTLHNLFGRLGYPWEVMSSQLSAADSWRRPLGIGSKKTDVLTIVRPLLGVSKVNQNSADAIGILLAAFIKHGLLTLNDIHCAYNIV